MSCKDPARDTASRARRGSLGQEKIRLALVTTGCTSAVAQVLLMREIVATFYGNELLFGLVLMAWLGWVAVGAWGLSRWVALGHAGERAFKRGLALAAVVLPVEIVLVRGSRSLLGITPGASVPWTLTAGVVMIVLAPLCLLMGLLFVLGARLTVKQGSTAGHAYVWEGVGALLGGVLFSFILIHWLNPLQVALLVASINGLVALLLQLRISRVGWQRAVIACVGVLALLAGSLSLGEALNHTTLRWPWPDPESDGVGEPGTEGGGYRLVFSGDSSYGRLTVRARDGQVVFYQNGLLAFESQGTVAEEIAHFALLMDPSPQDVLLIGGGVAGDLREILKHPVDNVTYVELDPLVIEAARAHLPPESAAILDDPRVTVVLTDGRLFIRETIRRFDVVILDVPAPSTGALNRFYTREFFAEVQRVLKPGGVFSLGLPSAENYWSAALVRRNGSVYRTLRTVFPEVIVLPGEQNLFLASDLPLAVEPKMLGQRLLERDVEVRRVTPEYINYVFSSDRFEAIHRVLGAAPEARINRDLTPICYHYSLLLWLSRFSPEAWGAIEAAPRRGLWGIGALGLLPLAVLLARWRRHWAVPLAIAGIGLAGMMLEVVILFTFQVLRGTVYGEVSLIVAAFMAGVALGGEGSNRVLARVAQDSATRGPQRAFADRTTSVDQPTSVQVRARKALIGVQIAIGAYAGLFSLLLAVDIPAPRVVFPLLALLAGSLGGMAFPLAMAVVGGRSAHAAGKLYSADLLGGCVGALLSAVFAIPLLGIPATCGVIALVAVAGLLALM